MTLVYGFVLLTFSSASPDVAKLKLSTCGRCYMSSTFLAIFRGLE